MFDIMEKHHEIPDPKTRTLFNEILSSYQQGNFRSAIVMLWSVVIADLLFKLKFLENAYHNDKARGILRYIQKKQEERPTGSEWECDLVNKAYEELKFISLYEKENLDYLHAQRNACAHPVLTSDNLLLVPNRDTTRALIRNALEAVLLKTPLLHKELVSSFVRDIADNSERLGGYENLRNYINNKYRPNINEYGAVQLYRALWRFVFEPRTPEEFENLEINFLALGIILEFFEKACIKNMEDDNNRYQIIPTRMASFIDFVIKYPKAYNIINQSIKDLIKADVGQNIDKYFQCDFLSINYEKHLDSVINKIKETKTSVSQTVLMSAYEKVREFDLLDKYFHICIYNYCVSQSFNQADYCFAVFIKPYLSKFTLEDIKLLISESNQNDQTYYRRSAYADHYMVVERFYELGGESSFFNAYTNWQHINNKYLQALENKKI